MGNPTPGDPKSPTGPDTAGAARAPETPLRAEEAPSAGKRRSDRVLVKKLVEIAQTKK